MFEQAPVLKDGENSHPVPPLWHPTICNIVEELRCGRYDLSGIPDVEPLEGRVSTSIENYIKSYGCKLVSLPAETWNSSVYQWQGSHWEALVDLYTIEEGRSDLVLHLKITEDDTGYNFSVHLVYVP